MSVYTYTVQDERGKTLDGNIEAAQEIDAIAHLQRQGYLVLTIKEGRDAAIAAGGAAKGKGKLFSFGASKKVPAADMIFLAEQLAMLLKGSVPLVQGLKLIGQNLTSPVLQATIDQVAKDISGGSSLTAALGRHPNVFSDLWLAMVQAGETGGQLPKTLEELSGYINQRYAMQAKILTAFMYPAVLMFVSVGVLIFFIVKVVPTFSDIFTSFNLKLPPLTQAIVFISTTVVNHLFMIIGVIAGSVFAIRSYLKTEKGQWFKSRLLVSMPVFGTFIKNIMVEQFLTNFALLLKSGVDVIEALSIMENLFRGNKLFHHAVAVAKEKVRSGNSISNGFSQTKVFPDLTSQMMRMGEESGKLPEILETMATFYRRQIEQFVARLSSVIDPILVLGVGGIVIVIVMAVFMPIFQMTQIGTKG